MEIYLIRHTTPNIQKGVCYGQSDIDVINSFEEETTKTLSTIDCYKNAVVYSSPLKRCTKFAAKFSKNFKIDNRLQELNFGTWELKKWDEIPKKELDLWMNNFVNEKVPMGESYLQLFKRSLSFLNEISSSKKSTIIVITHAGVIRSILAFITNTPLEKSFDININFGQVFKIIKNKSTYKLQN